MKPILNLLILVIALGVYAQAQTQPQKKTSKAPAPTPLAKKPHSAQFTCPDERAAESCKCFEELWRARDQSVRTYLGHTAYACFENGGDRFFIVQVTDPVFPIHFDSQGGRAAPNAGETSEGLGSTRSFSGGIENTSTMPTSHFGGIWRAFLGDATFEATIINGQEMSADSKFAADHGISIDPEQITVAWRFKNKLEKDVEYSLTMQRSTGRFSESFTEPPAKVPFLAHAGRCIELNKVADAVKAQWSPVNTKP